MWWLIKNTGAVVYNGTRYMIYGPEETDPAYKELREEIKILNEKLDSLGTKD